MLLTKQFFSWLLLLIMIFSTAQVTAVAGIALDSPDVNCKMPLVQMSDSSLNDNCPMQHDEECQQTPGCLAQFIASVLPVLSSVLLVTRSISQLSFVNKIDSFVSQYPSQIKRPPRS